MDEFFPSEIARLVLGYLKENKCEKSSKVFLEESSNLEEYCLLYKRGKLYPTNVNGKSLLDILSEYCQLKKERNNSNNECPENTFKERCKMILEDVVTNAVEHVLQKYFPSICYSGCHKDDSVLDVIEAVSSKLKADNCIEYGNIIEKSEGSNIVIVNGNNSADISSHSKEANRELNVTNADNSPDISSHSNRANRKLNLTNCNIVHSSEQSDLFKGSGVGALNHSLNLIESSATDSVYLQEIIKVEKDDNISILENSPEKNMSNICGSYNTNLDQLSNSFSGCCRDLHSTENISKIVLENPCIADSSSSETVSKTVISKQSSDSVDIEIIKTIKREPNSEVNCNENQTIGANCSQNSSTIITQQDFSTTVEITSVCNTETTAHSLDNAGSSISFSNNLSGYALQATPFSSQPVTVTDMSFSSVPTYILPNYASNGPYIQNNAQYSFIINPPSSSGFPLTLPNINSNSLGPVLTSVESIPSVPGICVNAISSPVDTSTVVDDQAQTVPEKVPSSLNAAGSVHVMPNSNLVTSVGVLTKSDGKLVDKQIVDKKSSKRKNKVSSQQSRRKLVPNGKVAINKNSSPNNAIPPLQKSKMTTRRKGK